MPTSSSLTASPLVLVAAAASAGNAAGGALAGIVLIVVLISWAKLHPFLSLAIGALVTGAIAGMNVAAASASFASGFGATMGGVGILIALGAIYGKLLADSGGADRIVETMVAHATPRSLPWVMGAVGAIIGLPMFFDVGLVLLMPVVILVARRSGAPLMRIALPTLAGLSAMHGLVPPHPGPLAAIGVLGADLGLTLALGVLVAVPAVVIAGPLFARHAERWVPAPVPPLFAGSMPDARPDATPPARRPSFAATLVSILLPVVLMLAKAIADIAAPGSDAAWKFVLDFLGLPMIALGIAVIAGLFVLGRGAGFGRARLQVSILLPVVLMLAKAIAVVIRIATGSATVATITAAGILQPLVAGLDPATAALLVLAIGSGSVFLSHLNDAGFWLVKEYFGLDIGQTLKSWTVLECLISVVGLAGVLLLGLVV